MVSAVLDNSEQHHDANCSCILQQQCCAFVFNGAWPLHAGLALSPLSLCIKAAWLVCRGSGKPSYQISS